MKSKLFDKRNLPLFLLLIFFIITQVPVLANNLKNKGKSIPTKEYLIINEKNQYTKFPPPEKSIVIFWASWCGPCKVEMARLGASVKNGKIGKSSIFAINPFEEISIVQEYLKNTPYPFTFIDATDLAFDLNINATPTTLFLDGNRIESNSSGMSLTGIWSAENFLKQNN